MERIALDELLPRGLYLIRSESDTVFILRFRSPMTGWNMGASHVRRLRGPASTLNRKFDGWWLPLVSVAPRGASEKERWPSTIEVGSRPVWVHAEDPRRSWSMETAWILQREVISIDPIGYNDMRHLAGERGLFLPPWTPGQDDLIGERT